MANRRMFSKLIVQTDAFLSMPPTSQLLYFHLAMEADDDGFVASPKKIMRSVGSAEDDYKILLAKRFILQFENGVCVIKHWLIHNLIRNDRYTETQWVKEKSLLQIDKKTSKYQLKKDGLSLGIPDVIPDGTPGKDRLGEVKVVEVNLDEQISSPIEVKKAIVARMKIEYTDEFEKFWDVCPLQKGKFQAFESYKKIDPKLYPTIIEAMKKQAASGIWTETKWTPWPATWLNQIRWEDKELKSAMDPMEAEARALVKQFPSENDTTAQFRFAKKYGNENLLKFKNLFNL